MHKITRIIALILGVLGLALCGWLMISSDEVKNSLSNFPMNGMFILGYLLLAIGLVVVIFSATKNILLSYPLSYVLFGTDSKYQWTSAGIMATYLLLLITLISVIFSVVKKS